ncbi:nitroreductase family protein [Thaumasiovibrio sp. DFM-14]|uniref:nitroreductase family protein n=1 Tax=Thaumasiovibrio sp. DFM-14 TaxID=3384792 RepID=UPI00399F674B
MTPQSPFEELIHSRRSVRKYDQQHAFDHTAVTKALDLAVLSPNSSNMQLWEFHRVIDSNKRAELANYCMGQNAAKSANELVVFTVTPRKWRTRAALNAEYVRSNFGGRDDAAAKKAYKYYEKLMPFIYNNDRFGLFGLARKVLTTALGLRGPMMREVTKSDVRVCLHKSASLAAMTFMTAMRDQGYDTCPMEGFDSVRIKKMLGLTRGDEICMVISCGKRTEEGIYGERMRVDSSDVIFTH